MKKAKKILNSAPVVRYLSEPGVFVDNKLEDAFSQIRFKFLLGICSFRKQKGAALSQVMFALILWPLLGVRSINSFCGKVITGFYIGKESVLYDFLKREDLNWRKLRLQTASQVYRLNDFNKEPVKAFVFDDTLRARRGKGIEGASSHFDHTINRCIRGQQVLEMGLVSPKGYIPVDSQLFTGDKKRVEKQKPFKDARSAVARDYNDAINLDKNKMMRQMLKRALRSKLQAEYVIGDAWFGTKGNIESVLNSKLTGIFRMKNSKMKYRINDRLYTAEGIYAVKRFHSEMVEKKPWKTFSIAAEINLEENDKKRPRWVKINLIFVTPKPHHKKAFALFLCTDLSLSVEKVLEIYSLRWAIEVYFKEVKQYMGFLVEQTGNYACHYASIHISAIRYILFSHILMVEGEGYIGAIRNRVSKNLELLSFASLLWELFRALIFGTLDQLTHLIGEELLETIKVRINCTIREFLENALQLDEESLIHERRAVKAGVIGK
ncbi:MAG: transposase [Lentisphaerae bacterium]|nr:transposase [Lentisphaerota bacterium]